ncbi:hypothetical protein PsorP6_001346 [Peronosclerospora sorghi]|uniref:Uncharacterized protein n=1 Tax=Peronosclerospora sorghi TaxID=230839 RepID=A0ACC0WSL2_9STRA|nr:hypothetical protein PsorP6_001346 [Peronosclerospora sorghi]
MENQIAEYNFSLSAFPRMVIKRTRIRAVAFAAPQGHEKYFRFTVALFHPIDRSGIPGVMDQAQYRSTATNVLRDRHHWKHEK